MSLAGGGAPLAPGSRLGEYRIESLIRTAPGGASYRARQPGLDRPVVLYVSAAPADSEPARDFVDLSAAVAAVDEPRVLPVYEVGEHDGRVFAAVRAVPGRRLDELLADGPLAADRAAELTSQLAAALEALDRVGVPARRLTPADVVVGTDGAYLAALEPALDRASGEEPSSAIALARLVSTMVTGRPDAAAERLPPTLRPIVTGALSDPGGPASPSAFARALLAAITTAPPPRRRPYRAWALSAAGALALGALVAVVLIGGRDEPTAQRKSASPDAPAGRIVATIPLGGTPISLSAGAGGLWIGLSEGTVVHVDPHTNRVVGVPIRFGRPAKDSSVTVRAGEGAVFAVDGKAGTVARIDPIAGRVTRRAHIDGNVQTAAVSPGALWLTLSRRGGRASQLVRLDPRTLLRAGHSYPIGSDPIDIEPTPGAVWVTSLSDGTVTRIRPGTGEADRTVPTGAAANAALARGVLWVPDPIDGLIAEVDARTMRPRPQVVRASHPYAATVTRDAVWVAGLTGLANPGESPGKLYRVDQRTGRLAGRPVDVGRPVGQPVADGGAVWISSAEQQALLKVTPSDPPPAPVAPARRSPRLRGGPLRPGHWEGDRFAAPYTLDIREPGWVNLAFERQAQAIGRVENGAGVQFMAPTELFTPRGGVQPLRSPSQVLHRLRTHPKLDVTKPRRTVLGGIAATAVDVRVDARRVGEVPAFCDRPCVLAFSATQGVTTFFEAGRPTRVFVLAHGGATIVVLEDLSVGDRVAALLDTLRFD